VLVQGTVYCRAPPAQQPGPVPLFLTLGDGRPASNLVEVCCFDAARRLPNASRPEPAGAESTERAGISQMLGGLRLHGAQVEGEGTEQSRGAFFRPGCALRQRAVLPARCAQPPQVGRAVSLASGQRRRGLHCARNALPWQPEHSC
jgi:hypothetical protein